MIWSDFGTDLSKTFLNFSGRVFTYQNLCDDINSIPNLNSKAIVLEAENTYLTFIRFLGLLQQNCIVHMAPAFQFNDAEYRKLICSEAETEFIFWAQSSDAPDMTSTGLSTNSLIKNAIVSFESTLIVRTSGSSGKKFKFVLHDPELFIKKYIDRGSHFKKTFSFSPIETIAGIETLLETVVHQNELTSGSSRPSPGEIIKLLEMHQVEYFQTTPSFMNLMSVSGQIKEGSLPHLKKIAYGSEPSQKTVLEFFKNKLPHVEFMHTYGMTEIGIQKTFTDQKQPDRFVPDGVFNPFKLKDGFLYIKSKTPMLGYLNYHDKADDEGWFNTGDMAQEEDGHLKVTGRDTDLINLAGRKFFPSEVEELIMQMAGVFDVTIKAEPNELIGSILVADIVIAESMEEKEFRSAFKKFCQSKIPYFMHPHKIIIIKNPEMPERFKKIRKSS